MTFTGSREFGAEYTGPLVVGVVAGAFLILMSGSLIVRAVGLGIIGLTFLLNDIATIKRLLFAAVLLEMPIQIDVFLGHDPTEAARGAVSGFNVSVTTVALVLLYAIWIVESWAGTGESPRPILRRSIPVLAYTALVIFSLRVAGDPRLTLFEINILVQALLVLVYTAHAVQTRRDALFALSLIFWGILIQVGISLLLFVRGSALDIGVAATREIRGRVAGTLGHPNSLGAYLGLLLPSAAAMAFAPVRRWLRALAGGAFVSGTVVLALSQSRGAYVGFAVALVCLGVIMYRSRLVPRATLGRGALLAMVPLVLQVGLLASRLAAVGDAASRSRVPLMELAWRMITNNALFGVGANNFAHALDPYLTVDFSADWISTVHNRYMLIWAETGLFALAAFIWFLLAALARATRVIRSGDRTVALAAAGLFAGIVANAIHMTVDQFHSRPLIQLLWFVAGLLIALERLSRRDAAKRTLGASGVGRVP